MNASFGGSLGRARFRVGVIIEPVYSGSTLVGYAKVTRDITEKYNAIQHLREAEHALAQSRRIEAIGKLTLGISHDFNNILSVILGSLDLIGKGEQDPRRLKLLSTAAKAAERGSQLSARMLAFARGQNLSPDIHDVHTLISDSTGVLSRSAGPVPCSMHMGASSSVVRIDAAQFMAALVNLVVNARDAGDVTGMRITTTVRHPDMHLHVDAKANTRYLWTSVADNGPGMSEETQARAMEPFFTTKDVGNGSGLGLSQVFGFAAQSGGFASIESVEGEGTTVSIAIPLWEGTDGQATSALR